MSVGRQYDKTSKLAMKLKDVLGNTTRAMHTGHTLIALTSLLETLAAAEKFVSAAKILEKEIYALGVVTHAKGERDAAE